MKPVFNFLAEVKTELTKVTWPKKNDTLRLTFVVLAISAVVGAFVGGLDFLFTKLLALIITR
jgi:preprotein translocase subunit SecE